jgi:hypothetical protein
LGIEIDASIVDEDLNAAVLPHFLGERLDAVRIGNIQFGIQNLIFNVILRVRKEIKVFAFPRCGEEFQGSIFRSREYQLADGFAHASILCTTLALRFGHMASGVQTAPVTMTLTGEIIKKSSKSRQ